MAENPLRKDRQVGAVSLIAVLLVLAGLKVTAFITMPMGLAFLAAAMIWPLQVKMERKVHRVPAVFLSLFLVLAVLLGALASVVLMVRIVGEDWQAYAERVNDILVGMGRWAQIQGWDIPGGRLDFQALGQEFFGLLEPAALYLFEVMATLFLFIAYLLLFLLEVPDFDKKLRVTIGTPTARKLAEAAAQSAHNVRNFMYALGLVSAATGVLVALYTWFIGLDFPIVWGLLAFVLNFIPTLGSIISVFPPTLLALIQPGNGLGLAVAGLTGLTLIQFITGNYIAPILEGRFLALSPLVVLFSIGFWGWIWGIPGAFLGVPFTAAIVVFCAHFEPTQWLAQLLAEKAEVKSEPEPSASPSEKKP